MGFLLTLQAVVYGHIKNNRPMKRKYRKIGIGIVVGVAVRAFVSR